MSIPSLSVSAHERLRNAGLRPTRQRLALARLVFGQGDRHWSADAVYAEAVAAGISLSLATVYNTLNQFTEAGLLRQVAVEPGRAYFDTNTREHHHFYIEEDGVLVDIPVLGLPTAEMPDLPQGTWVARVDVIVRLHREK